MTGHAECVGRGNAHLDQLAPGLLEGFSASGLQPSQIPAGNRDINMDEFVAGQKNRFARHIATTNGEARGWPGPRFQECILQGAAS